MAQPHNGSGPSFLSNASTSSHPNSLQAPSRGHTASSHQPLQTDAQSSAPRSASGDNGDAPPHTPTPQQQQQQLRPGQQAEPKPRELGLKVRILALETRGKDLCVRLDAITNHPSFRLSHYPPFLRSFRDLSFFALSLSIHVPTHILSSLPLPSPTFDSGPSESRLLSYNLSKWFARLAAEPAHRDHPETRNFIESEYSYQPIPPNPDFSPPLVVKRWRAAMDHVIQTERGVSVDIGAGLGLPNGVLSTPATPSRNKTGGFLGFGGKSAASTSIPGGKGLALSRNVNDEDEDLVAARMEVTRLELQFSEAAKQGQKVVDARAKVTQELHALSNKLHTFAGLEDTRQLSHQMGLPQDLRKLADGIPALDITQQATSNTDSIALLYPLLYQSANARSAKDALLARNALVEEHHEASKRALLKKREVETLKSRMGVGSSGISRDRIEFAIEDFSEASRYAQALRHSLQGMSATMHKSLQGHSRNAHADLQQALVEHAKGNVFHLRKNIQGLKKLRASLKGEHVEGLGLTNDAVDGSSLNASDTGALSNVVGAEGGSQSTLTEPQASTDQQAPETTAVNPEPPATQTPGVSSPVGPASMSRSSSTNASSSQGWPGRLRQSEGLPNTGHQSPSPSRSTPRRQPVRNPWTGSTETGFSRDYTHHQPSTATPPMQPPVTPGTGHHERFAPSPLPTPPAQSRSASQTSFSGNDFSAREESESRNQQQQTQSMFLPRPSSSTLQDNPPPPDESPFATSSTSSSGFLTRSDAGFGTQSRFGGGGGGSGGFGPGSESMGRGEPSSGAGSIGGSGLLNSGTGGSGLQGGGFPRKGRITASDAAKSLAGRF